MEKPTPRVNKSLLHQYRNQVVRLVGKVMPVRGQTNMAIVETSDQGQVTVHMNQGSVYTTKYVEIIGMVNEDLSIQEMTFTDFGDNFDMSNYNELVTVSQQVKEIFTQ